MMCLLREDDVQGDADTGASNEIANVVEIGQTLAAVGDKLNEERVRNCDYFRMAALGMVLTLAMLTLLNNTA